jgi:hypothetical protein
MFTWSDAAVKITGIVTLSKRELLRIRVIEDDRWKISKQRTSKVIFDSYGNWKATRIITKTAEIGSDRLL